MERAKDISIKIILISFFLIESTYSFNTTVPPCFKSKVHVHYVNGVNTIDGNEKKTKDLIKINLEKTYRNLSGNSAVDRIAFIHPLATSKKYDKFVSFDSTYNQTHWSWLIGDLFEAADQIQYLKDVEQKYKNEAIYRVARGINSAPLYSKMGAINGEEPFIAAFSELFSKSLEDYRKDDGRQLAHDIKAQLENGNKVLVVSHSQGNLFSNEAFVRLFDPEEAYGGVGTLSEDYKGSIGALHIASPYPTSFFSNNDSILLKEDLLITPLPGVSGNYSITRGPSSVSSTPLFGEVANVEGQALLTVMRRFVNGVSLPTLGHSIDDLYLSENYFATGTRYNGEEVSMMGIVVDSMNTVAQNFEPDCKAPIIEDSDDFISVAEASFNLNNRVDLGLNIDFSKVKVGFHVEEAESLYSNYIEGDLKTFRVSVGDEFSNSLTIEDDGRIRKVKIEDGEVVEDVYVTNMDISNLSYSGVHGSGINNSKTLYVNYEIEDIFGKSFSNSVVVPLCEGAECCVADKEEWCTPVDTSIVSFCGSVKEDTYREPSLNCKEIYKEAPSLSVNCSTVGDAAPYKACFITPVKSSYTHSCSSPYTKNRFDVSSCLPHVGDCTATMQMSCTNEGINGPRTITAECSCSI